MIKIVYVDYSALNTLALTPKAVAERYKVWQSMQGLWRAGKSGKAKLVTSKPDMEKDIILRLNMEGCCIADVLRAKEAIEEFKKWGVANKERASQWKRILFFLDQIETLPQTLGESLDETAEKDSVVAFLSDHILSGVDGSDCPVNDRIVASSILQDCSKELPNWYTEVLWQDLKRTDYQINWQILSSILPRYGVEPVLEGDAGAGNRCLFGLLNRVIGLSKKSCRKLPIALGHVDFIVNTVLKKYDFREKERSALHIYRCVRHGVPFFLTTDHGLIEGYSEKKRLLAGFSGFPLGRLRVVNPLEMQAQI